jgi:hypothetical protein
MTIVDEIDAPVVGNGSTPEAPATAPLTHLKPVTAPPPPYDDVLDDDLLVGAGQEEVVAAPGSAKMLRLTRIAATSVTAVIGMASFVLSFASLSDLAVRADYPDSLAPLWPIIVDGAILASTMAVLALGPYGKSQRGNRRFFWWVLAFAATVSVACNGLHAVIPAGTALSPWLKAAIGVVPPVFLLLTAHGAAILSRIRPMTAKAVRAQEESEKARAAADKARRAEERRQYWIDRARVVQEQNPTTKAIAERPVEQIAEVLELAHRGESQRGVHRITGVRHEAFKKILDADVAVHGELVASSAR